MTVDYGQQLSIKNAVGKRVYQLWDDGIINCDVHDNRKKVFAAIWRDFKGAFAFYIYCNILQKEISRKLFLT
ncbi:ORF6C domain-containing protein [Bacillus cereus]|uniref:ORF6C domain-containing protein n=1 Tax=Bacillus cereus TaxID=1396 RepID=UPI0022262BF5|nr:ORF6C domain-containing protein [Bacillus cereus]